jgi:hypothetical protein
MTEEELILSINENCKKLISEISKLVYYQSKINHFERGQIDLFDDETKWDGEEILKSIDELRQDVIKTKKQNSAELFKKLNIESYFLDLLVLEHLSLFTCLFKYCYIEEHNDKAAVNFLSLLLLSLHKNMISMKMNLEMGFNQQANLIFRNYIELSELALAFLIDDEIYSSYTEDNDNNSAQLKKWLKTKPGKIHAIIDTEFEKISDLKGYGEVLNEIRNKLYKKASDFTHGAAWTIVSEAFAFDETNEESCFQITGSINNNIINTFYEILIYSKSFLFSFIILLVRNRKITFEKFGDYGKDHIFLKLITDELCKIAADNYRKFNDENKTNL